MVSEIQTLKMCTHVKINILSVCSSIHCVILNARAAFCNISITNSIIQFTVKMQVTKASRSSQKHPLITITIYNCSNPQSVTAAFSQSCSVKAVKLLQIPIIAHNDQQTLANAFF